MARQYIGSDFDDMLAEDGIREEVTAKAIKRVIAWQLSAEKSCRPVCAAHRQTRRCGYKKCR
jgi:hypothetical protein